MKHEAVIGIIATITIAFYSVTLCLAIHNTYKYLLKQKRFKVSNTQLISFYLNTIIVLSLRICQFSIETSAAMGSLTRWSYSLGTMAVMFQMNIGGCMILLM